MKKHLRALVPYITKYKSTYVAGMVFMVVSNALITLGPKILEHGINLIDGGSSPALVARVALLLVGVTLLGGTARFGMRQLLNSGSRRVEFDLRNDLFGQLERLSPAFYDRASTGDLMSRSTNDLLAARMAAGPALMYLVDTAVRVSMVLPAMFAMSPRLTMLALLPLLGLPVVMLTLGQQIHHRSLAIQEQFGAITTHVHEHISGLRVVRAYRQERAETEAFRRLNDEYRTRNISLAKAQGAFRPLLALLAGLGAVVVLAVGGRLVMAGTVSVGEYVAFGVYLMMLAWPLIALGWAVTLVQRADAAMGRINALFEERPAITSPTNPALLPPRRGARRIGMEGVWFKYPGAQDRGWVLQDVSFRVNPGESLAIVGATGAGKSTIAELLSRSYDPDQGRVLLDGLDIRTIALEELRRNLGVVPQETFLFGATVRENILLGAPDDGRLERVAEVSQFAEAVPDLPNGYDTMLGERGINLSGGQKQRAAIARALAQDPPVFILDDALSAVDAHTEARILAGLRDALAGRTSIIISHRLAAVRDADWIIVLDGGQVVEQGVHADLLAAGGRYWELLNRQELEEQLEV
ncbi:MAG: ABC transporter ATP-binding protein [Gemmatimonadales bacterium]|nr:MAG: ABC transporter ATP-binding protein [Gemmatimonadales bacterium]